MKLLNIFKTFKNEESGAVTVDWVVLTAAIVGLGLVVINVVGPAVVGASNNVSGDLAAANTVGTDGRVSTTTTTTP